MLAMGPPVVVLAILHRWSAGSGTALHGIGRMVAQLALVGYLLTFLFGTANSLVVLATLTIMLGVAGWIALRPLATQRRQHYPQALASIAIGGICLLYTSPSPRD